MRNDYFIRGQGGDVIVTDETSFMSDTLFFDTMLPMVEKKGCVLLMNSTLVDRYNFYTRILDKLEEEQQQPKPCGHVFRLTLICQRCLDRERMIGISATHCKHMLHLIPPWKEASKLETVRRLMDSDREKIFRRESLGVLAGSSKTLFDHNDIKYFNEMPYFQRRIDVKPDPLYLIVDPNAGGPSHMAIILMTRFCDKMVVCIYCFVSFICVKWKCLLCVWERADAPAT